MSGGGFLGDCQIRRCRLELKRFELRSNTSQNRDMGHPARSPRSEAFVEGMNKPMGAF